MSTASRCFIAVWPDDAVVEVLKARPRPEHPAVRWVPPERWHVTLAFLGRADCAQAAAALEGLVHGPVSAVIGTRIGRFATDLLVAPVTGCDDLAAEVRSRVEGLGSWHETRPFLGHLTLARLTNSAACPWATPLERPLMWTVNEIRLVASELTPAGPHYCVVATIPLRG